MIQILVQGHTAEAKDILIYNFVFCNISFYELRACPNFRLSINSGLELSGWGLNPPPRSSCLQTFILG